MIMSLTDGVDTVTFSPRYGYAIPQDRTRNIYHSLNGDQIINEQAEHEQYEIPLNAISKTDYDLIYGWWDEMTKLTFTPDTDAPGTVYYVRIVNTENPLQMMSPHWATYYEGTLSLREVPALS